MSTSNMQRRILFRPLQLLVSLKPKPPTPAHPVARHAQLASLARAQLPFLAPPLANTHQFRYLTTERKRWLLYEVYLGFKWSAYLWIGLGCCMVAFMSVQQEWLERRYPTPHEWWFWTRVQFRQARYALDQTDLPVPPWVRIMEDNKRVISRLEDKDTDGDGLEELTEPGIWTDGNGKSAYDISMKSEAWRRGYYEAMMLGGKAAETLNDFVVDRTRHIVFPAEVVIGPSNPNPLPIPFGAESAPLEENCERPYDPPETFYMRIITTRGFSSKQKMDAALACAAWFDYKGVPDAALSMYERALTLASGNIPPPEVPYDQHSYILRDDAGPPSSNILEALTALAAHKARNDDVASALPILLSILRARRSLAEPQPGKKAPVTRSSWSAGGIFATVTSIIFQPAYPPPPDDGESPPVRDAKERCEEAGLNMYIGEIIYASNKGKNREDGLAWTREAVDLAEEQLHRLPATSASEDKDSKDAKKRCRECLAGGLENWAKMVARLAREEREREKQAAASGGAWFGLGLWGDAAGKTGGTATSGRWAAEESVVTERTRRAQEVLDEEQAPSTLESVLSSIFSA